MGVHGGEQRQACKKVYANADAIHDSNPDRTRAVRKVVRLTIEKGGGDGAAIKKDVITNYTKGRVWYKEDRVAEWDDSAKAMKLKGQLATHQEEYDAMVVKKGPE